MSDKKVREVSGMKKGSKLVAIPFKGGMTLVDVSGKSFVGNISGFGYKEEEHEASKFLTWQGEKESQQAQKMSFRKGFRACARYVSIVRSTGQKGTVSRFITAG